MTRTRPLFHSRNLPLAFSSCTKKTILRLKTGATTHALCYAKFRYRIRNGLFYDTIIRVFINMFVIYARGGAMQCGLDNASKTIHQERAKNFALL